MQRLLMSKVQYDQYLTDTCITHTIKKMFSHGEFTTSTNYCLQTRHFIYSLRCLQGKEHVEISDDLLVEIAIELRKENTNDMTGLNHSRLKVILKNLHAQRYYEHMSFIISTLNHSHMFELKEGLEEQLISMFDSIQLLSNEETWIPGLSHSFCLRKLCVLLGETPHIIALLPSISHGKSTSHDLLWEKVCIKLDWARRSSYWNSVEKY